MSIGAESAENMFDQGTDFWPVKDQPECDLSVGQNWPNLGFSFADVWWLTKVF